MSDLIHVLGPLVQQHACWDFSRDESLSRGGIERPETTDGNQTQERSSIVSPEQLGVIESNLAPYAAHDHELSAEEEQSQTVFTRLHFTRLHLIHRSARDYLTRLEWDTNPVLEEFRLNQEQGEFQLARKCLDRIGHAPDLLIADLKGTIYRRSPVLGKTTILQYAAYFWPEHATSCPSKAELLYDTGNPFFNVESSVRVQWWRLVYQPDCIGDLKGLSILNCACRIGILPWVQKFLVELGDTVSPRAGWRASVSACRFGYKDIVEFPSQHLDGDSLKAVQGAEPASHPLTNAAWAGSCEIVTMMLNRESLSLTAGSVRDMALVCAVEEGHADVTKLLLERGANAEAKGTSGMTCLDRAARHGQVACVRILLTSGASVNVPGDFGATPLNHAMVPLNQEIVEMLLRAGADVNSIRTNGDTA